MNGNKFDYLHHYGTKIELLEKLIEVKNKEIELYRETLKSIGCEIKEKLDTRTIYDPNYLHDEEDVPVLVTSISLEKRFATRVDCQKNLDIINTILEK